MTKHLRVAVLDRARVKDALATEPLPDVPDARVSTVTESSINFFVSSGAWSRMLPHAREFGSMQVCFCTLSSTHSTALAKQRFTKLIGTNEGRNKSEQQSMELRIHLTLQHLTVLIRYQVN